MTTSTDPSSSEQSCDTVIYLGPRDDEGTDAESPPVFLPALNAGDQRGVMSRVLRGSSAELPPKYRSLERRQGGGRSPGRRSSGSPSSSQQGTPVRSLSLVNSSRQSTGSLPRSPKGKMPLYGKVAGYRQPPSEAATSSPRISLTPSHSGLSGRSRGSVGEIWVDSQPNCDRDLVSAPTLTPQYDNSGIYGYMDEHKKAMIQQWVEGQSRGGPSIPPSHLTGVDSLAWLQERAEEQAQGQYTALTQFKVASSSASSCSSPPPGETQAVVEVERPDPSSRLQELHETTRAHSPKEASPRREAEPLNLNLRGSVPPPPPLRGGRAEAGQEEEECRSKASSGSRGSSRRSDVGTTTEGLGTATTTTKQTFNTKLQDPFGAPRKVALPRASPEKVPGTRTLDELYQHCEQLVETLSQASEELKSRDNSEECLRISGIDDIEIYSVEEGSEGSVEVGCVILLLAGNAVYPNYIRAGRAITSIPANFLTTR